MADTNVMVYLTKSSPVSDRYMELLDGRRIAISFQVRAELGGYPMSGGFGNARQQRLEELISACVHVPHSEATNTWYARVNEKRQSMPKKPGDGDVWVIAQALEHGCPLMTNDRYAADLASAMGVEVLTALR